MLIWVGECEFIYECVVVLNTRETCIARALRCAFLLALRFAHYMVRAPDPRVVIPLNVNSPSLSLSLFHLFSSALWYCRSAVKCKRKLARRTGKVCFTYNGTPYDASVATSTKPGTYTHTKTNTHTHTKMKMYAETFGSNAWWRDFRQDCNLIGNLS